MNESEPLDLSALDPAEDPAHWQSVVDGTLERIDGVLDRRSIDPLTLIAGWSRPVLLAAAAALAVLVPVELALEEREDRREQVERLVALSLHWEMGRQPPTGTEFVQALQEENRP